MNNVTEQLLSGSIGHLTHLRYLAVYHKSFGEPLVSGEGSSALHAATNSMVSLRPYHLQWLISGYGGLALPAATNSMVSSSALPVATNSMVSLRPYHLQWLISGYGGLALPAATKYLVSLRHFGSVSESYQVDIWNKIASMSGIGKLTCLQELERFSVGKTEGRKLAELKRLNEIKGTLELRSLHNASTKEEALEANLNKKVGIRKLVLDCNNGHATPHMAEEVFEGLCPPPCIKNLTLDTYLGEKSPTWMLTVNGCLSVLQSLTLFGCRNWKVLPPFGQLPLLRSLEINAASAVEEIGSSFYGSGVAKSFRCLEKLEFRNMPEWVVWSGVEEDTDSLFPRLRKLTVMDCWKLERVPMQCLASVEKLKTDCMVLLGELEKLTSLKELVVEDCKKMQLCALLSASLVTLEIRRYSQLSFLFTTQTETQTELPSLRQITISGCPKLVSAELKNLPSLQKLHINDCERIQSVPVLPASLVSLEIRICRQLSSLFTTKTETQTELPSLRELTIFGCNQLVSVELKSLPSLEKLKIIWCGTIQSVPVLPDTLVELEISWCDMLIAFSGEREENLSDLISLRKISIQSCPQLRSLPFMPPSLQQLDIAGCPKLPRNRYRKGGDDWHKISHIPDFCWEW